MGKKETIKGDPKNCVGVCVRVGRGRMGGAGSGKWNTQTSKFELRKLENGTLKFGFKVPSSIFESGTFKSWIELRRRKKKEKRQDSVGLVAFREKSKP